MITDTEILKTERFGSREKESCGDACCVCGMGGGDSFWTSAAGESYCSIECRESIFKEENNDKKGAWTAVLFEQGDNEQHGGAGRFKN